MIKKILFIIVIAVGLFLRVYQVTTLPAGFFIDEVNMAVDAKSLVENQTDQYGRHFPFMFEDATDNKLPGYIYAAALSYAFFGNTTLAIRLPSLLASILSIAAIGYLTFLLFPKKKELAYYAMSVLALSPFAIHFARIAYETVFATFFLLLFLIALIKIVYKKSLIIWYIVGILSMVISMWTYPGPRFIIPTLCFILMLTGFWIKNKEIKGKSLTISSAIFFLLSLFTFIPSFLIKNLDSRPLSYLAQSFSGPLPQAIGNKFLSILSSYLRIWNLEFLFDKGSLFAYRHGTKENGLFLLIAIIPFTAGIFTFIKNYTKNNFSLFFLLLLTIICGLPSALTYDVPYMTRLVPMLIPLSILIAMGVDQTFIFIQNQKRTIRNSLYIVLGIILLYQVADFYHIYFVHFKQTSLPEFPTAPAQLAHFITSYEKADKNATIYFLNSTTCQDWGEDALHLWYFADLPSKQMIIWNNKFRDIRYHFKFAGPFDALDKAYAPKYKLGRIVLFPGFFDPTKVPADTVFIRCGYSIHDVDVKKETVLKIIYMYDQTKLNPYYIIYKHKA